MRRLKPRQSRHRHRRHHDRVFFPFFYLCVQSGYGTRILFPRRNNVTCSVLYVCARLYYIILLLLYYSIYSRSYYFFDIVCAVSRTSSYEGAQRKRRIPFLQVSRPMSELVKRAYISPPRDSVAYYSYTARPRSILPVDFPPRIHNSRIPLVRRSV